MNVSISRNGAEIGEWPEDEVRTLYKNGKLLPTDYYWKEGMTAWAELPKMIKPTPPTGKAQPIVIDPAVVKPAVAPAGHFKYQGLEGSGTQDDPIQIIALNAVSSAWNQNDVLDAMFGKGGFDRTKNQRLYYESPRGLKGNEDLCETRVTLNDGSVKSVWFDLYMVTRITSQKQSEGTPKAPFQPPLSFEDEHKKPFIVTGNCARYFILGLAVSFLGVGLAQLVSRYNTIYQICMFAIGIIVIASFVFFIRFEIRLHGWFLGIVICSAVFLLAGMIPLIGIFIILIPYCVGISKFRKSLRDNGYKLDWYGKVVTDETKT